MGLAEKAKDAVKNLIEPVLDVDKIVEDMFFDVCSSSGWTREEIKEMEILPEELDLDEWTMEEFSAWVAKWLSKTTGYYVEYVEDEKIGDYYSFQNAISQVLAGMTAINEKAKEMKDTVDNNTHVVPVKDMEKNIGWATHFVCRTIPEVPKMIVPEGMMKGP